MREALAVTHEVIELPEQVKTVGDVRAFLLGRGGIWVTVLGPDKVLRMAYNQVMCEPETELEEGCEVAFFPQVTGG